MPVPDLIEDGARPGVFKAETVVGRGRLPPFQMCVEPRPPVTRFSYLNQIVSASHWPSVSTRVVSVRPFFILTLAVFLPSASPISAEA